MILSAFYPRFGPGSRYSRLGGLGGKMGVLVRNLGTVRVVYWEFWCQLTRVIRDKWL